MLFLLSFTCFLDASKAFDLVNHWRLFKIGIDQCVPILIIRLLLHWHAKQTLLVRWGHTASKYFSVSNGVRQGSVLSPHLSGIYMD